mgnify:CR=1 FL=1
MKMELRWFGCGLVALGLTLAACGDDAGQDGVDPANNTDDANNGGKADEINNPFLDTLATHQDPLGQWLRERSGITREGIVQTDYVEIVLALADQEGCSVQDISTFLISDSLITGAEPFPRTVTTICTKDPAASAEIFLSMPEATEDGDLALRTIEMFAWDPSVRTYRFYKLHAVEGSDTEAEVEIEPAECAQCHTGPTDLDGSFMPMAPVMNELTLPWPHWNSQPDAENHSFIVGDDVIEKEGYNRSVAPWLGTAPNLEQIIRKGFEKVNGARLRARRNKPADPEVAMSLLRPLFCTERVNYVTEDGGNVLASAYIDEGLINMYSTIDGGVWPWAWYNDRKVRIGTLDNPSDAIDMIAVRGAIDADYEERLVSVRGLTADQVLRVKALDWKSPAFSDFRCNLWRTAMDRVRISPPQAEEGARTLALLAPLYEEIMTLPTTDGPRVSLVGQEAILTGDLLDDESAYVLADAIAAGTLDELACQADAGICATDLQGLGTMVDAYIQGVEANPDIRADLLDVRNERACLTTDFFPNSPDIPNVLGCSQEDDQE